MTPGEKARPIVRFTRALVAAAAMGLLGARPVGGADAGKALTRPRLVAQLGHLTSPKRLIGVNAVAFSRDGAVVLTGSEDGTAILWDAATGREVRRFEGHSRPLTSVAFSPDGRFVLTGSEDDTARLWATATGAEVRRLGGHGETVLSVAFSPDGRLVLTAGRDRTARLWDAATGAEVRRFEALDPVALSADGRFVLTTHDFFQSGRLWETATGKEVRRLDFTAHGRAVRSVAFSPDGRFLLTGSYKTARLWETTTGKEVWCATGHDDWVSAAAFSPDGRFVVTGSEDTTTRLWDARTGKGVRSFDRRFDVRSVAFSPDGRFVLAGYRDGAALLWDAATGREVRSFRRRCFAVYAVAFSPDGRSLLACGEGEALWDLAAGRETRHFPAHTENGVYAAGFSADGRSVFTRCETSQVCLWEAATGKQVWRLDAGFCAALSPDGRLVLTGHDGLARLREAATGKEVRSLEGHRLGGSPHFVTRVAFSPDGRLAFTGDEIGEGRVWEVATGKEVTRLTKNLRFDAAVFSPDRRHLVTDPGWMWEVSTGRKVREFKGTPRAFSRDGRLLLTTYGSALLWEVATGKEVRRLEGHQGGISAGAFSPDGRLVATGGGDGTTRLWEAATGKELCRLLSFRDGTWAVVDAEGRFDASGGGDVPGLHWVVGNEPIALEQLKDRYYDPGLLAKKLGFNKEPVRDVAAFNDPKLYPAVHLADRVMDGKLRITLANRGGGIGRVVVKVNGKELTADARAPGQDPAAATLDVTVDLADDPRLQPGTNRIEVEAYNAEGYLRSRGLERPYEIRGKPPAEPPAVWAVVAGISRYRGEQLQLRYAAKDAADFAGALRVAAGRLFGPDRVRLTLLTSDGESADARPTRDRLVRALEAAREAKPTDVLVLYLAGHGVNHGGPDGDFYYLTADAQGANLTDPEVRRQAALSSRDLTELAKRIPAQKQVLILDTCAAGRAVDRLTEKRDVPSSQVRALERVKDRTGLFILAGCADNAVSYEATRYAQGVLTYSLLLGMRGARLRDGQFVDVAELFGFAADKVPELARDIGGIQRPVLASPRGASFDIGQVTAEDQARIPLQAVRPLVLRASFQEEEQFDDVLGLGKLVDERLRGVSARGRRAPLVFVDARDFPEAHRLAGRYRIAGDQVTLTVNVFYGPRRVARFTLTESRTRARELAEKVVAEAEKALAAGG